MNTVVHYDSIVSIGRALGAEQAMTENLLNKLDDPQLSLSES